MCNGHMGEHTWYIPNKNRRIVKQPGVQDRALKHGISMPQKLVGTYATIVEIQWWHVWLKVTVKGDDPRPQMQCYLR